MVVFSAPFFWPARAHHSFRLLFKVEHSKKEFASRHSCHRSDLMRPQAQYSHEILAPHLPISNHVAPPCCCCCNAAKVTNLASSLAAAEATSRVCSYPGFLARTERLLSFNGCSMDFSHSFSIHVSDSKSGNYGEEAVAVAGCSLESGVVGEM